MEELEEKEEEEEEEEEGKEEAAAAEVRDPPAQLCPLALLGFS